MCRRFLQLLVAACSDERRRRVKRHLSYVVIICNFFLGGFEYGVIFPTAMDYLASLGAEGGRETTMFGLLIVCYAAANIVGGYVGGLWADMFIETRPLLVLAALPQIIGNALYFFAASPTGAIASHALSGLGSGANTAMLAELTRTTSLKHRTSVIGVITFARQLGIVCGPAVGAYLTGMPDIFRHRVTLLNAPGLLLMLCYLCYMVMLTLFYSNLTVDDDESGGGQLRRVASGLAPAPAAAEAEAMGERGQQLRRGLAEAAAMAQAQAEAVEAVRAGRPCPLCESRKKKEETLKEETQPRSGAGSSLTTPDNTPPKRPGSDPLSGPPPGPTPQNTPQARPRPDTTAGAAGASAGAAGGSAHTPQRPLVLSLPQPSPSQCSSWPPYLPLVSAGDDDKESAPGPSRASSSKSSDPPARREPTVVWPHTPDFQPPSCRCAHDQNCQAPLRVGGAFPLPPIVPRPTPVSVVREWRELLCWPIAALLVCNFAAYMTQTSLEALLPALVERDLRLAIDATGEIFIAGGLVQCVVLVCIFVTPLLPCMRDERLITTGLLVMILAHVQLLATICMLRDSAADIAPVQNGVVDGGAFDYDVTDGAADWSSSSPSPSPSLPPRDGRWFWIVLVGSGVQFFGYPLVNSVVTSFMSKMLSRGAQGVGAAGLRLSMCTGLMLGPVWGSGMLHYQLPLLLLPLAILLGSVLLFCWFERRGAFRVRMRQAAAVDTVTPRVCAAPRRLRTISALSQIREAADDVSDEPLGGACGSDASHSGDKRFGCRMFD